MYQADDGTMRSMNLGDLVTEAAGGVTQYAPNPALLESTMAMISAEKLHQEAIKKELDQYKVATSVHPIDEMKNNLDKISPSVVILTVGAVLALTYFT